MAGLQRAVAIAAPLALAAFQRFAASVSVPMSSADDVISDGLSSRSPAATGYHSLSVALASAVATVAASVNGAPGRAHGGDRNDDRHDDASIWEPLWDALRSQLAAESASTTTVQPVLAPALGQLLFGSLSDADAVGAAEDDSHHDGNAATVALLGLPSKLLQRRGHLGLHESSSTLLPAAARPGLADAAVAAASLAADASLAAARIRAVNALPVPTDLLLLAAAAALSVDGDAVAAAEPGAGHLADAAVTADGGAPTNTPGGTDTSHCGELAALPPDWGSIFTTLQA